MKTNNKNTIKRIQKTNYLSPTVVFYIEDIALSKKSTFNHELNHFLEQCIKKEDQDKEVKNILEEIRSIKESHLTILDVLSTILEKE
jgi:hypothetical protein